MTSRERVAAAINLKEPDMVPLSIASTSNDCFTKMALRKFARHLGLGQYPEVVTWQTVQTVITPPEILERFGADFRTVRFHKPDNLQHVEVNPNGSFCDALGVLLMPTDYYYDAIQRPLQGDISMNDIRRFRFPATDDPGLTRGLRAEVQELASKTDFALVVDYLALGPFEGALWVRGWEDFLCDLCSSPKLAEALMDKVTEYAMEVWGVMLDAVGDLVDVLCLNDDLGMQDRSLISPEIYRRYIKKYTRQWYSFIRRKSNAKILHHSCGSVYELLPDLIDCGVQILNPIQVTAKNMEPERLKRDFGDSLAFWGGLDIQRLLAFGTPCEVEEGVKRIIDTFGPGGGYVFAPSHNIQPTVPVENMLAMFDSAVKYRGAFPRLQAAL
jgi:uroporphyrinogen decarboxylase